MTIKTYFSDQPQIEQVVEDFKSQGISNSSKALILFSSVKYPQKPLIEAITKFVPNTKVFGCSTAGEIVTGRMTKGGVGAMAFDEDIIEDISIQVIENLDDKTHVVKAFEQFESYYQTDLAKLDIEKFIGIVLFDGLAKAEERLMDWIGDLTDITFIGGSAGDDLRFKQTYVYANSNVYTQAAVLVLIKTRYGFDTLKTQSFNPLDKQLVATQVDEANRTVISFNGKPARDAYSELTGYSPEKAEDAFMHHPVGLMVGDEPFVRSPQRFDDEKMVFYCNIMEGMEYRLLESTDIVLDTQKALRDKGWDDNQQIAGILNFHCILRTLELESKSQTNAYGELFSKVPTLGFSTYGEAYIGHMNQTSTMIAFKA